MTRIPYGGKRNGLLRGDEVCGKEIKRLMLFIGVRHNLLCLIVEHCPGQLLYTME
jgi:hypothetical protein